MFYLLSDKSPLNLIILINKINKIIIIFFFRRLEMQHFLKLITVYKVI